jgi:hypothetical protein
MGVVTGIGVFDKNTLVSAAKRKESWFAARRNGPVSVAASRKAVRNTFFISEILYKIHTHCNLFFQNLLSN